MRIDKKFQQHWINIREKGKFRYCLIKGIRFAILMYFVLGIVKLPEATLTEAFLSIKSLMHLGLGFIIGVLFEGPLFWWINDRSVRNQEKLEFPT